MKKIKIMLMSLLILAVAGGALAFKAKFSKEYCTTLAKTTVQGGALTCKDAFGVGLFCPIDSPNITTIGGVGNFVCTTTTNGNPADPCSNLRCLAPTTKITVDQ